MAIYNYLGFTYHCNNSSGVEELAATLRLRQYASPGIGFARKVGTNDKASKKYAARAKVLSYYTVDAWPDPVSILTLPGYSWLFERKLIGQRMDCTVSREISPQTKIHAVENEVCIYRGSLRYIPGRNGKAGFKVNSATSLSTGLVRAFEMANVEDLILKDLTYQDTNSAWLDFTGFLTPRRLLAIQHLWNTRPIQCMTITLLNARTSQEITRKVKKAGGVASLIGSLLENCKVSDVIEYAEPSPMIQATFLRSSL